MEISMQWPEIWTILIYLYEVLKFKKCSLTLSLSLSLFNDRRGLGGTMSVKRYFFYLLTFNSCFYGLYIAKCCKICYDFVSTGVAYVYKVKT